MRLEANQYGKSRVRLVKVRRGPDRHDLVDLTIDVRLAGDFDTVYTEGDNRVCLPTDTMKNTVYVFARREPLEHLERFAERLAEHFAGQRQVSRAQVSAVEQRWDRLNVAGVPAPHAFLRRDGEQWTADVVCDRSGTSIAAGIRDLVVLKTTDSAFSGFQRDEYTTLRETEDRILATSVTAVWRYRRGTDDFAARDRIRQAMIDTFAAHRSRSVQHTLYAMAEAGLSACSDVVEMTIRLPNRHHVLVDLAPFGLDNPNEVFVATDEPYGVIEGTVHR